MKPPSAPRAVDGRVPAETIGGKGAAPGHVLTWDGGKARWTAPSGGGAALLGVAQVHMPSSLAVTSDGANYHFTTSSVVATHGSPAVSSSSGFVTYSVADAPGFYVMNAVVTFDSNSTNAVSSDAHQIQIFDPIMGWLTCGFVGSSTANNGYGLPYASAYTSTSETADRVLFRALCTGGTDRVHHVELLMFIARFEIPS